MPRVTIRQYYGPSVLSQGEDTYNPWRNGQPGGSLNIQDATPDELRAAAAALIEAADIIDGS